MSHKKPAVRTSLTSSYTLWITWHDRPLIEPRLLALFATERRGYYALDEEFDELALCYHGPHMESHETFQLWLVSPEGELLYSQGLNNGYELKVGALL